MADEKKKNEEKEREREKKEEEKNERKRETEMVERREHRYTITCTHALMHMCKRTSR